MPVPVITVVQMREWEKATWASGQTEKTVIATVGKLLAQRILQLTRPGDRILVLAGKGNNGEDARLTLPHLRERQVELMDVSDPAAAFVKIEAALASPPHLIIDGLFGIGLNRPLSPDWCRLIRKLNECPAFKLAVDVPSGFDAGNGTVQGEAVRAHLTLTLGAPKTGLLAPGASSYVGRLEVAPEIGLTPCTQESDLLWTLPGDFQNYPPRRAVETHKGTYGHLIIIAGSLGYHGAAVLAARAAARAQPGLITLLVEERAYVPVASQVQSVMVRPFKDALVLPENGTAIVFGPGLAANDLDETVKRRCRELWQNCPAPVLADASALTWLPDGPAQPGSIRIITPHPGEAAKMLGVKTAEIQGQRVDAVRRLSLKYGRCRVVLKGHHTLVGRSTGSMRVNGSGNPYLAQGGSGDLLAGFIGGLLAQRELISDVEKVLGYAVWEHGAAADRLSCARASWSIEELAAELRAAG